MSRAHLAATGAFLACVGAGLAVFLTARSWMLGALGFAGLAVVGIAVSGWLFDRLATPAERAQDLEDRLRNTD